MDITTLKRKVKRQFGDEYDVQINDQDIFDWIGEAQTNIVRDTSCNDFSFTLPASGFPYIISDKVLIKRVAVNNKALIYTTLSEIDAAQLPTNLEGTAAQWYYQDNAIKLWPKPAATDTYSVEVAYSRLPTPMTLVAPYLQWDINPPAVQFAKIPTATWMDGTSLNLLFNIKINNTLRSPVMLASKGTGITAATFSWYVEYVGNNQFRLSVSNGSALKQHTLDYSTSGSITPGSTVQFRITYNGSTGTSQLYRHTYNALGTLIETLDDTDVTGSVIAIQTQATPIEFGALNDILPVGSISSAWQLNYFQFGLNSVTASNTVLITFDGEVDLTGQVGIPISPFTLSSGQAATVNGKVQVFANNQFSVPEVYHEDIVRYCLARAHERNENYRGAEQAMGEFDKRLATRANEAQSVDTAIYKVQDPFDFDVDVWWS